MCKMKSRILKYNIQLKDFCHINLPMSADILTVTEQHGNVVLYARVWDDQREEVTRTIYVVGTGRNVPEDARYISTVSLSNGGLMFHVMESMNFDMDGI